MADILMEFEQQIAANKKDIEEQERALAVLRRTMARGADQSLLFVPGVQKVGKIIFEDLLGSVEKAKKRTLIDETRDIVAQFGNHEFTVAHIEAALKKTGKVVDVKNPRARIGIALSSLLEEEFVIRTFDGAGNVPHRYKLKSAIEDESLS